MPIFVFKSFCEAEGCWHSDVHTYFILPSKTQSNWIFFVQFNTSSEMHLKPPIKVSRGSHAAAVAPALEGKVFISLSQNGMAHWDCWINVLRRCWIQLEFALHLQCGCLKIPGGGPKKPWHGLLRRGITRLLCNRSRGFYKHTTYPSFYLQWHAVYAWRQRLCLHSHFYLPQHGLFFFSVVLDLKIRNQVPTTHKLMNVTLN